MASLHLMCGLPGSGKTTEAKRLENELPAMRLTPDEWLHRIEADGLDAGKRAAVEALQWTVAARALSLGINVILENGFRSRAERELFRTRAASIGAELVLHFMDVPLEELQRRVAERNAVLPPDTFLVHDCDLLRWWSGFEVPCGEELL